MDSSQLLNRRRQIYKSSLALHLSEKLETVHVIKHLTTVSSEIMQRTYQYPARNGQMYFLDVIWIPSVN